MIKQIFSDMDGTVLAADGKVTDITAAAIRQAQIPFTLVSARAPMEMTAAIDKLGLTTPQIGFNGGIIFTRTQKSWQVLEEMPLDADSALHMIEAVAKHSPTTSISFYDCDHWYCTEDNANLRYEEHLTELEAAIVDPAAIFQAGIKLDKVMLINRDKKAFLKLQKLIAGLHLKKLNPQVTGNGYLEVTAPEATKAHGIYFILKQETVAAKEAAAFGDGENDLPMFQSVGLPIAMDNAVPAVKAAAKHVTASNSEDGIAKALAELPEFK